jgi:hypothetical protein
LCVLGTLLGFLIFQLFFNGYYDALVNISIVAVSYGISAIFIIWLSVLFLSWYKSSRNFIVFLYFVAMLLIAFNLIMTGAFVSAKVDDRPDHIGEFIGSSGDTSGGRHAFLDLIYRVSSFIAFFSIWIITVILMNSYREKLFNPVLFWIILSIPLIYFSITFFYQFTLGKLLFSYLQIDPITVSIILSAFLSMSKPIGGLGGTGMSRILLIDQSFATNQTDTNVNTDQVQTLMHHPVSNHIIHFKSSLICPDPDCADPNFVQGVQYRIISHFLFYLNLQQQFSILSLLRPCGLLKD